MDLTTLIGKVVSGQILTVEEAEAAFTELMSGRASPVQMAAFLAGLRTRGHAASEVAGGVRALQAAMIPVESRAGASLVDTCGTGGGEVGTFNISTAAALVAAGAGARVAKHGNRSFTSRSGSADVLEALGVAIQLSPAGMARVLDRAGIVFMFAPLLHPAMRHVGPVRKELRIPTMMNVLGPLTNPARVRRQVVGVADAELLPLLSEAMRRLGHERSLVVHGLPGMDEVSPLADTLVAELRAGEVREYRLRVEDLGLARAEEAEIAGGEPEENAELIRRILLGDQKGGARTAVLLNAAAALYVAGLVDGFRSGVAKAAEAVDSGAAARTLELLAEASRAEAEAEAEAGTEAESSA
jgi:anthranilate phosphoribosyltransferase